MRPTKIFLTKINPRMNNAATLSPVGEYLEATRKKLQSNPLSLSASAYRETLALGPEMLAKEAEFARACYMEGYKKALEDIKENFQNEKDNPKRDEPVTA
jgi:hypothetical protein